MFVDGVIMKRSCIDGLYLLINLSTTPNYKYNSEILTELHT